MFANFNFVNNNYNKNNFINNNNNNNNNFNNYSNLRYNNSQANIEISYDNYFTNNYYKEIEKEKYANDLRQQIEENKLRKEYEKRKKEEEDLKDELRLIKENQQLELQQKKENKKIISNNNNNNININNNIKTIKNNNNNNNYLQSYLQQRSNEIKTKDNEIKNLLSSINDTFFHQINRMNFELEKLKEVNLHSNLYKIDLAKSIQDLSNTLHKKNYEQSFKKDSIYKMMIETNKRKLNLQNHLKLNKIPYYNNNNYPYINLSRSISYNVPRTKPLKELGWYY